jgi:hypothetical protein
MMVEAPRISDEWDRANRGKMTQAETESWGEIGRLIGKEGRFQ